MEIKKAKTSKNFIFMTLEGSFFLFGISFLGENTIVPIFVDTYTGSMQLLGLTLTLLTAAKFLPKLISGPYVSSAKDMAGLLRFIMLLHRPLPLIMIPVLLFVKNPTIIFIAFVLMYCIFWSVQGITSVVWSDVFGRTISGNRRGQLQGNQQLIGGIASLFAGYLIKLVLDNNAFSNNTKYLIIFSLGGFVLLCSALVILPVQDLPRQVKNEKVELIKYFTTLPRHLGKNRSFTYMTILQVISRFGDLLSPFIIIISKDNLHFTPREISTLVVFQVAGAMLGGFSWGSISRKFGNKHVIVTAEVTGLLLSAGTLLCIMINPYMATFQIMCIISILAGAKTGAWLGYGNYLIDVAGEENIIDYMVLNSLILFPLSFANYFAGLLNDSFGFLPLVMLAVCTGIICTVLSLRLKVVKHGH